MYRRPELKFLQYPNCQLKTKLQLQKLCYDVYVLDSIFGLHVVCGACMCMALVGASVCMCELVHVWCVCMNVLYIV